MIPRTAVPCQTPGWQQLQARAVTRLDELLARLDLDAGSLEPDVIARPGFPLRVPEPYLALMERGNPRDPLLLQVLPGAAEERDAPGFGTDPLGEWDRQPVPGLIEKYPGRVLLILTGACALHCRYCFRRHFPYDRAAGGGDLPRAALEHVAARPKISEVILSGGDPLSLADRVLAPLVAALARIPHVERLRIHSRTPVAIPQRLTPGLADLLGGSRLRTTLVLHANHPREVSRALAERLAPLRAGGVTLLNQSVLLRGVNDSVEVLASLSEALFSAGTLPYYLHMLDPVRGAAHFQVPEEEARALHRGLRKRLPGYLVPRLAREEPGVPFKTLLE